MEESWEQASMVLAGERGDLKQRESEFSVRERSFPVHSV